MSGGAKAAKLQMVDFSQLPNWQHFLVENLPENHFFELTKIRSAYYSSFSSVISVRDKGKQHKNSFFEINNPKSSIIQVVTLCLLNCKYIFWKILRIVTTRSRVPCLYTYHINFSSMHLIVVNLLNLPVLSWLIFYVVLYSTV